MTEFKNSRDFLDQISRAAISAGFRERILGVVTPPDKSYPIIGLSKKMPSRAPRILIAAGIHGDEPSGPHAVLSLLETFPHEWPELSPYHVEIVPLINPTGFDRRQRTNWQGIDLNRSFGSASPPLEIRSLMNDYRRRKIDLFVDFHEDVDTPGFYLYELSPVESESFGAHIITVLRKNSLPVNASEIIEGMPAINGLILRTSRSVPRFFRKGAPQGLYMKKLGTVRTLTFETPTALPLEQRVSMHLLSLRTTLKHWKPGR
jgi:hypothetical protein